MLEIDYNGRIACRLAFCRRIVPNGNPIVDRNWRRKLEKGVFGDIILHNSQTQVPKGFKVTEERKRGEDMGLGTSIRFSDSREVHTVHICKKQEDGNYDGHIRGMWYKWVTVEKELGS